MAFTRLEPLPLERQEIQKAHIVQAIVSVFRGKGQKAPALKDFVIQYGAEPQAPKQQSQESMRGIFRAMVGMMGGKRDGKNSPRKPANPPDRNHGGLHKGD